LAGERGIKTNKWCLEDFNVTFYRDQKEIVL
jgi:hypothetical protein